MIHCVSCHLPQYTVCHAILNLQWPFLPPLKLEKNPIAFHTKNLQPSTQKKNAMTRSHGETMTLFVDEALCQFMFKYAWIP